MSAALQTLHWLAGLIVIAEALNKLERTCPLAPGLIGCERLVQSVKALGWALLALGAGGAVATPVLLDMGVRSIPSTLLRLEHPTLAEVAVLAGFAILIIRTRLKEGCAMYKNRRIGDAR
ncbi:MAG: hypothetical protein Q7K57_57230 [Burkholderiaceae bacterium]|nr:hypothetical protein [Burkholderiaceae bacterium]